MAVPARPVGGASIESAWGGVVHDGVVAMDIQSGVWTTPSGVGSVTVTYPRPFASTPAVLITLHSGSRNYMANTANPNATNFQVVSAQMPGTTPSYPLVPGTALGGSWLAIGPRA